MAQHQHRCHFDLASIKVQKCINKQICFSRPAKGLWNDSLYIRNPLPAVTFIMEAPQSPWTCLFYWEKWNGEIKYSSPNVLSEVKNQEALLGENGLNVVCWTISWSFHRQSPQLNAWLQSDGKGRFLWMTWSTYQVLLHSLSDDVELLLDLR